MHTADASTQDPDVAARWRRVAAALLVLEALPALGASVVYLVELLTSEVVVRRNVVMLVIMGVLVGAGLLAVARGLWLGRRGARSPAITWQILMVAVGGYVLAASQVLVGSAVLVVAVVTVYAVARANPLDD